MRKSRAYKCPVRTIGGVVYSRKIYNAWRQMIRRCENPRSHLYYNYGAIGITVCDRWHTFANFVKDMGEPAHPSLSLQRKDGTKGYSPDNCCWATAAEQGSNHVRSEQRKRLTFGKICSDLGVGQSYCSAILSGRTGKRNSQKTLERIRARAIQFLNEGWTLTDNRRRVLFPETATELPSRAQGGTGGAA